MRQLLYHQNQLLLILIFMIPLLSSSFVIPDEENYQSVYNHYRTWLEAHENSSISTSLITRVQSLEHLHTIDDYYFEAATHQLVIDFFVELTGVEQIALPILFHAEKESIPIDLMFAVSWTESKYKPYAVNHNKTSIDRGLFQLNSLSFAILDEEEFFHPEINTMHAARYLRYCLDKGYGDVLTALAIYNAGLTRVRKGEIPQSTLVYRERVIEYMEIINRRFTSYIQKQIRINGEVSSS